jgi:hypothetical protein
MDIAADIRRHLGDDWICAIYREVRDGRTRSVRLDYPERENRAEIQYTLLGIELKVGKRRFAAPELATARYMRVFARIGCREFAVPYDITQISSIADRLETSWQNTLLLLDRMTEGRPARGRTLARSKLIKALRLEINKIGAGDAMPLFDRETRQRKR